MAFEWVEKLPLRDAVQFLASTPFGLICAYFWQGFLYGIYILGYYFFTIPLYGEKKSIFVCWNQICFCFFKIWCNQSLIFKIKFNCICTAKKINARNPLKKYVLWLISKNYKQWFKTSFLIFFFLQNVFCALKQNENFFFKFTVFALYLNFSTAPSKITILIFQKLLFNFFRIFFKLISEK